ncbi:YbaK/EbsC family protein [Kurthia gibsonii]|uniref:YbaK/EbsC family protein n=1 Tax=Kurthia gibsonii TaxID=33946 RepID=UPI0011450C58|nr:YbaK/EbsC family protein [Kurthia gibsonii]GED19430.1 proline--tRNA ligase [Kurthia gibsonii]
MSLERAQQYFEQFDLVEQIQKFDASTATVQEAAQALGCEPERIAKTLSFNGVEQPILIVAAGDTKIDNAKFKATFQLKPRMLKPEEVEKTIGHAIGGVCPFGINEGVRVYLDESLKRFTTVFPACGSSNSAIELTIPELERYAQSIEWMDVCKNWRT